MGDAGGPTQEHERYDWRENEEVHCQALGGQIVLPGQQSHIDRVTQL